MGRDCKTYTDLAYDVFLLDYRGYGKSDGSITSQEQLFEDLQIAYNEAKEDMTKV
jgi:pimeloyl-ACP methyl ester carboxylesterase